MGLLRGMARTAVVAGTATAVTNRVSRRQYNRWSQETDQDDAQQPTSAAAATADPYDELEKLGRLKDQGVITQAEFEAKKKQLLGL